MRCVSVNRQHAVPCAAVLPTTQVFIRDADVRRERDALAGILQPLVADMLRHVCHTSASMPDLPVPDDSFSTLASLLSPETRQDVSVWGHRQ